MQEFVYGSKEDIKRLVEIGNVGGYFSCKFHKMPNGKLSSLKDARICDINHPFASAITNHYYRGISAHKDNMVIEIWKLE